jgi:hypothetical protein
MNRLSLSGRPNPPVDSSVSIDHKTGYNNIVDISRSNINDTFAQTA